MEDLSIMRVIALGLLVVAPVFSQLPPPPFNENVFWHQIHVEQFISPGESAATEITLFTGIALKNVKLTLSKFLQNDATIEPSVIGETKAGESYRFMVKLKSFSEGENFFDVGNIYVNAETLSGEPAIIVPLPVAFRVDPALSKPDFSSLISALTAEPFDSQTALDWFRQDKYRGVVSSLTQDQRRAFAEYFRGAFVDYADSTMRVYKTTWKEGASVQTLLTRDSLGKWRIEWMSVISFLR